MIVGLDKVLKALEETNKSLSPEEVKKIVRDESRSIIISAQNKAPSNDIKNSIGFIERNEKKFPNTVLIGPRYYGSFRGQLSHTFEYGTAPRYTKTGAYRGFITARPFMRPALDENANKIVTNVGKKVFKLASDKLK